MYQITAHSIQRRMDVSRTGIRSRRLPAIVLGEGSVIRLSPGASVTIDERTYEQNQRLLAEHRSLVTVKFLGEAIKDTPSVEYDDIETLEPLPAPAPEPEPVVEEPVEELVELAPAHIADEDVEADIAAMLAEPEPVVEAVADSSDDEQPAKKRRGRRS